MLKCELKKFFSKKINRIVIVVIMLLAVILSCFAIGSVRYTDESGQVSTGITSASKLATDRNKWKGQLTEDKITEIVNVEQELNKKYPEEIPDDEYGKNIQSYEEIKDFVIGILTPDSDWDESVLKKLTDEEIKNIYVTYKDNMNKMVDEYGKTSEQKEFISKQYEKTEFPLNYESKDSWDTMILYAETYGIILAVAIGFLVAGIFAEEFQTNSEDIFFSTKYGRSKATKNKILSGILITTIIYWVSMIIMFLILSITMGISGFNTPYQISEPYSIYNITYGEYYLLVVSCGFIGSLLSAAITMFVTTKTRNSNIAICIPFFMFCVMPFIGRALSSFTKFFRLTPDMLMNIMNAAKDIMVLQIGNTVFRQIPFIMLLYTVISIILIPFIYKSYCNYGLKKSKRKSN